MGLKERFIGMRRAMMSFYVNRTICDALDEMRKCNETRNYAYLLSLVEEVQSMANRMEAALGDIKDIKRLQDDKSELKKEVKKLEAKKKKLGGKKKPREY